MYFVLFPAPHHLQPDSPVYWFLMQIGIVAGLHRLAGQCLADPRRD